jgi:hypothetical protein
MRFSLEDAKELRRQLLIILKGLSSKVELTPAEGSQYRVIVIQRDAKLPELPPGVETIKDNIADPVDNVTGQPSSTPVTKDLSKPQTETNRTVEPPDEFRSRNRSLQDMVKKYAHTEKLVDISDGIQKLASRDLQIDSYLETIREALLHKKYTKGSQLWKLLQSVFASYDIESAEKLCAKLTKEKFEDGTLHACKQMVALVLKKNGIAPDPSPPSSGIEVQKLKKETAEQLVSIEKVLDAMTLKLRRLGLKEEANKMDAMSGSVHDICGTVNKLGN